MGSETLVLVYQGGIYYINLIKTVLDVNCHYLHGSLLYYDSITLTAVTKLCSQLKPLSVLECELNGCNGKADTQKQLLYCYTEIIHIFTI